MYNPPTAPKGAAETWPRDELGLEIEAYLTKVAGTVFTVLGLAQYMCEDTATVRAYLDPLARSPASAVVYVGTSRDMAPATSKESYTYFGVAPRPRR